MLEYKYLSEEERAHFVEHGWLKIENAIAPKYLTEWMDNLWVRLGMDPEDKSTWNEEYIKLPRHREVRCEDFCPLAWKKILEVVGGEDKLMEKRERWFGDQMIINLGKPEYVGTSTKPEDCVGFHTDNDWYRQFLDSSGNALTLIFCFTDVPKGGGGTVLCEDGIVPLLERWYAHPEGIDPPFVNETFEYCARGSKYAEVVARAGDLYVTHGMLPHSHSPNHLNYARVITNPHVNLREPFNLDRPDGDYTLCEQVILRGLGRESIPEYRPTRERLAFYPRTAWFKRERVTAELQRMIADAERRGLPASSVDSIYLRGEEAIAEHEARNGYDKEIGPTGVVSSLDDDHREKPAGNKHIILRPEIPVLPSAPSTKVA